MAEYRKLHRLCLESDLPLFKVRCPVCNIWQEHAGDTKMLIQCKVQLNCITPKCGAVFVLSQEAGA